jgi:hypothetical protein
MSINNHLFGVCSEQSESPESLYSFDLQSFVNKFLLFDKFTLYSPGFIELPHLVKIFGYDGAMMLLQSGDLRFCPELRLLSQVAQHYQLSPKRQELPPYNYSLMYAFAPDQKQLTSERLRLIGQMNLEKRDYKNLKLAIMNALDTESLKDHSIALMEQVHADLEQNRYIEKSTKMMLERELNLTIEEGDFFIQLHRLGDRHFFAESNIGDIFSIDEQKAHKIIEKAIFGIANLNQRIVEMRIHGALSGFLENDSPLYHDKVKYLMGNTLKEREENLNQVFEFRKARRFQTREFPSLFDKNTRIDAERLLEIRKSDEIIEFRNFVQKINDFSEEEAFERVNSIRSRLGMISNRTESKISRFFVSCLIGSADPILGIAYGFADSFLIDQLLPSSNIVAFIDKLYPSIFKGNETNDRFEM